MLASPDASLFITLPAPKLAEQKTGSEKQEDG